MSAPLSAATLKRGVLDPSLEATAHNLFQFDPSPEIDSALERIHSLASALPPGVRRGLLLGELEQTINSNVREGREELAINGFADSLVADLRDRETNGGRLHLPLTAKSIARRLRGPLSHIAQPAGIDAATLLTSCRAVSEAIRAVPRVQLLSPAVRHELGRAPFELLERLAESQKKNGAAQVGPAGAAARRSSHGAP